MESWCRHPGLAMEEALIWCVLLSILAGDGHKPHTITHGGAVVPLSVYQADNLGRNEGVWHKWPGAWQGLFGMKYEFMAF